MSTVYSCCKEHAIERNADQWWIANETPALCDECGRQAVWLIVDYSDEREPQNAD